LHFLLFLLCLGFGPLQRGPFRFQILWYPDRFPFSPRRSRLSTFFFKVRCVPSPSYSFLLKRLWPSSLASWRLDSLELFFSKPGCSHPLCPPPVLLFLLCSFPFFDPLHVERLHPFLILDLCARRDPSWRLTGSFFFMDRGQALMFSSHRPRRTSRLPWDPGFFFTEGESTL